MIFPYSASLYLSEFIIPSIGESEPTPEKLKLPAEHFLLGVFYYLIERAGLNCSSLMNLTIFYASLER